MWLAAILMQQQMSLSIAGEYIHYTKILKRVWWKSFRKPLSSIHVYISLDTCCSKASWSTDREAVGTSRETRVHTDTMEEGEHNTWNRKTVVSQTVGHAEWGRNKRCTSHNTHKYVLVYSIYSIHTHTHLVSRFFSTLSCWLGLKLLALLRWSPLDLGRVKLVL